jgi:hypothetical protein
MVALEFEIGFMAYFAQVGGHHLPTMAWAVEELGIKACEHH